MDYSISSFLKENFGLIILFVSILGVLVGVISVILEVKKKSKNKKD